MNVRHLCVYLYFLKLVLNLYILGVASRIVCPISSGTWDGLAYLIVTDTISSRRRFSPTPYPLRHTSFKITYLYISSRVR